MREILFRGKRIDNGEWVIGDLRNYESNGSKAIFSHTALSRFAVIPETVCQYTGLTDKNGKKIFEGDIIKLCRYACDWMDKEEYDIEISVVEFENGCFVLDNTYSSDGYNELSCVYDEFSYADGAYEDYVIFEVIGNIHDHPELLGT